MILFLLAESSNASVFPTPKNLTISKHNLWGITNITFNCTITDGSKCPDNFAKNYKFFEKAYFPRAMPLETYVKYNMPTMWKLQINVDSADENYDISNLNESYSINVDGYGIVINASNGMALSRAFQSFSQLILPFSNFEADNDAYLIYISNVVDSPSFSWREIQIDISKNFLNKKQLIKIIDGMTLTKLNILHIQVSGDDSFSMFFDESPQNNLNKGAYSEKHSFTMKDLHDLQDYAKQRGVIIYLEVDMPYNIKSWGKADSMLLAQCNLTQSILNPVNPNVYKYVEGLLKELIFDGIDEKSMVRPIVHFGGNNIQTSCFDQDAIILQYKEKYNKTNDDLIKEFNQKLDKIMKKLYSDKKIAYQIYNEDQVEKITLGADKIIHYLNKDINQSVLENGANAIVSFGWELDLSSTAKKQTKYFDDNYKNFYKIDILNDIDEKYHSQVLGGGVTMHGEDMASDQIISQIFSRAVAVAEILWANPMDRNEELLEQGMENVHCKLMSIGLKTSPPTTANPCYGYFWRN